MRRGGPKVQDGDGVSKHVYGTTECGVGRHLRCVGIEVPESVVLREMCWYCIEVPQSASQGSKRICAWMQVGRMIGQDLL